jgi:septal ring factor EnvC (AmiA/AmiB activator)
MDIEPVKLKNMGMPARHISSQSFDEILSDLGDDPAIPDPHGIRKPPPQQNTPPRTLNHGKGNPFKEPLSHIQIKSSLQGFAGPIILIGVLIAAALTFFITHKALTNETQSALDESQKQISGLQKELSLMRDEIYQHQDDLYSAIDEVEVSIHSIKDKKPEIRVLNKSQTHPHESELRRWRYLGTSQMGSSYQAYFHTGKSHLVFEKGVQVLGDWRLGNIEKELVTLTNSQGKSLVLKASKSE